MEIYVVAIRDRAADVFGQPQYVNTRGIAIRGFQDEINRKDPANMLNKHPEDFDLYVLATYDDNTGRFKHVSDTPEMIAIGKDLATKE